MRIAILANDGNTFVKPVAEGLHRMLSKIGVESTIFYRGLGAARHGGATASNRVRRYAKSSLQEVRFYNLVRRLRHYDVVVVVLHLQPAFLCANLRVPELRRLLPKTPIVLYDLTYLPTRGAWARRLLEGDASCGIGGVSQGLDRYDWYLAASIVSEFPPPSNCEIVSVIGLDLDDGSLRPTPKEKFLALIDFEQPTEMKERATQITALEETGTPYLVLKGAYSIAEIRRIYQQCSLYFVAFRESFGLPICELQACGAYILTPRADWCPSHWMKPDLSVPGPGRLSPNFVVYDGDRDRLVQAIRWARSQHNPTQIFDTFLANHPQLFRGDLDELSRFVERVRTGQIHSKLHARHPDLRALVHLIGL